jgi:hypothetical protein
VVANPTSSSLLQLEDPLTNSAFTFGVREPRLRFVGRRKELDELTAALTCDSERLWVVAGTGGIGKSQLMKKFVNQAKGEKNCVWLFGESVGSLSASVLSLFVRLGLSNEYTKRASLYEQMQDIAEHIHHSSNKRPWIFIIDNVDENHSAAEIVVTTLLQLANVKTFVTSRLRHIFGGSCALVEVKALADEDAHIYVNDRLPANQSPELVLELCVTLQNHPLALSQAVDYIRSEQLSSVNENYSLEAYLNTFRSQSSKLLKHKVLDENTTVFHTCSITMQVIENKHGNAGKVAISLLRRLAYFDPDGVHQLVFIQFLSEKTFKSQTLFEDGLGLLKRFSLTGIEDNVITVHRLVQHVTKLQLQNLWWPDQYMDQLFETSKSLLYEFVADLLVLKQIGFIFQQRLEKQFGSDSCIDENLYPSQQLLEILYALRNNNLRKAQLLTKSGILVTLAKVIMAKPLWQKKTDVKTKKAKQKTKLAKQDNQIGRNSESACSLEYDQ